MPRKNYLKCSNVKAVDPLSLSPIPEPGQNLLILKEEEDFSHWLMPQLHLPLQPLDNIAEEQKDTTPNPMKPKRKYNIANFTEQQEKDLAEWYRENELLYNKKLRSYRDRAQKDRLFREKAEELNINVKRLHVWCEGMRTRFARVCDRKDEDETFMLSEREEWIQRNFAFLKEHIVRCPGRKSKKNASASSAPNTHMQELEALSDVDVDVDVALDEEPSSNSSSAAAPGLFSKRRRNDSTMYANLIEQISNAQQECSELNSLFESILQPRSQHSLLLKQFHSFIATMAEQIQPDVFHLYSKECLDLVTRYVNNPPSPRESKSQQQPQRNQPQ